MKKFIAVFSSLVVSLSLVACGGDASKNETTNENVTTTEPVTTVVTESYKDIAEELGIDIIGDVMSFNGAGAPALNSFSAHGGHQTRIVKTSHGEYCTYITGETVVIDGFEHYQYSLNKIDPETGAVTVLHEGKFSGASNSPYIMADDEENVWVACGHEKYSTRGFGLYNILWKYDHTTGEVKEYKKLIPAKNDVELLRGYGYVMSFIDNYTDTIYFVHCAGDAEGIFVILPFNMKTCEYVGKGTVITLPGRHCYLYGFADGKGGFSVIGQRDMTVEGTGFEDYFKNGEYWGAYVWDDIRLFSFDANETGEVVLTGVHEVDLADYVQESGLYPQNIHYRNGDVFADGEGNLHFIYRSAYDEGVAQIITKHTILDKDYNITYSEEISLDPAYHSYEIKPYITTDGVYYLAVVPKYLALPEGEFPSGNPEAIGQKVYEVSDTIIQLYRSEDGINYTMVYEEILEGQRWTPGHITAAQPRNGSVVDNKLSLMAYAEEDWKYFTIDLDAAESLYKQSK